MIVKKSLIILLSFMLTLPVWAVPARRNLFEVKQPDGTTLKVRMIGDEYFHCLMTEEGVAVELDSLSGYYVPIDEETLAERKEIANVKKLESNQRRARRVMLSNEASESLGTRCFYKGKKRGLVILVNYKDKAMTYTQQDFSEQFNQTGYSKNGHIGSVKDYFYDQSYGMLSIDFDVVGPYTVSENLAYYGKNGSDGKDKQPSLLISEACNLADPDVDFSLYDWDDDGEVDQVYVIYAGYGEAFQGADVNTIWPHEWSLSSAAFYGVGKGAITLDGVTIDTYACSSELVYNEGNEMCTIGTACHEFSHCLGFPDFYDSEYQYCPSMFDWDILDNGSYNGPNGIGEVPAGMTAYERWIGGWLELEELNAPCDVENLPDLGDSARAYIIYNEGNRSEAYILENRQNKRWFTYPDKAHGMLIYHIDYDASVWSKNKVNTNSSHPHLVVVPANNSFGEKVSYGNGQGGFYVSTDVFRGQLWPGTSKNTAFTDNSTPASKLYNRNENNSFLLGHPITDIQEKDGLISFAFDGGKQIEQPQILACEGSVEEGFHLNWNPVASATSYDVRIVTSEPNQVLQPLLQEKMSKLTSSASGTLDLSSKLDDYMEHDGWSGTKVFVGQHGAKLGSAKTPGTLISPILEVNGPLTVRLVMAVYGTDSEKVNVLLLDDSGLTLSQQTITITGVQQEIVFERNGRCQICISPAARCFVSRIEILSGASNAGEEKIIAGLTTTEYDIKDLESGLHYTFQVRAWVDGKASQWCPAFEVTGISRLEEMSRDSEVVYDLLGRRVTGVSRGFLIQNRKRILINP